MSQNGALLALGSLLESSGHLLARRQTVSGASWVPLGPSTVAMAAKRLRKAARLSAPHLRRKSGHPSELSLAHPIVVDLLDRSSVAALLLQPRGVAAKRLCSKVRLAARLCLCYAFTGYSVQGRSLGNEATET